MPITVADLVSAWRSAGLRPGDAVLVHSSLRRTITRLRGADPIGDVLRSFCEAVGPEGTLLFPLFNFEFTKGSPFDIRATPSQMGALTERARAEPDAVRTGHPVYSFAVLGRASTDFVRVDNRSGYGHDSPFGILHRLGGKIAVLDLPDQHSMTYYHYVEETLEVPYRFHKDFSGEYIDQSGNRSRRTYSIFVRDLERGVETHVDPMGEILWSRGLYTGDRPGTSAGLRVIAVQPFFESVADVITSGKAEGLLYQIGKPQP